MIETDSWSVIPDGRCGVCGWYTQIPLLCFTHTCSHYTDTLGVTFYMQVGDPALTKSESLAVQGVGFYIHFTCGVLQ